MRLLMKAETIREILSDGMVVGGIGVLAHAGFLIQPVIGWVVIGIGLLVVGIAIGRMEV